MAFIEFKPILVNNYKNIFINKNRLKLWLNTKRCLLLELLINNYYSYNCGVP